VRADVPPLPFGDQAFERLFTSFFYGHLEEPERAAFLSEARRVAGELVVVDAAPREGAPRDEWQERVLNDGSRWRIYKRYFSPQQLAAELGDGEVLVANARFLMVRA
jgi:ubiquinone/menaquinone biosynthesis C-methylase UbiE